MVLAATAAASGAVAVASQAQPLTAPAMPAYTADGRLEFPKSYRQWVYLSSGLPPVRGAVSQPK